jgi:hypothetical protein
VSREIGCSSSFELAYTINSNRSLTFTLHEVYLALARTPVEGPAGVEASLESVSNLYRINRNPLIVQALGVGKAAMAPGSNAAFSKSYIVPDVFRDSLLDFRAAFNTTATRMMTVVLKNDQAAAAYA